MLTTLRTSTLLALSILFASCSDNDNANFQTPDFPTGPGKVFSVQTVSFPTSDNVVVSARFGQDRSAGALPVVILLHDIFIDGGIEWELPGLGLEMMQRLLEEGYQVLLIDFRGFGQTPLPDDGRPSQSFFAFDIDDLHLEVRAALTWLATQPSADRARIGIIGSGMGANAAYVSMGAWPDELQAGIALSPGIYNLGTGEPLGIGKDIDPFEPHSMLFVASQNDIIPTSQSLTEPAIDIAESLHEITGEPKQLSSHPSDLHGSLLLQDPEVFDAVLAWLETHL